MLKSILLASVLLTLSACGTNTKLFNGFLLDNEDPQAKAGFVEIRYKFCKNDLGALGICDAHAIDGKQNAEVSLEWEIDQDGTMTIKYLAKDTLNIEVIKARAKLQEKLGEGLVDGLTKLIKPTLPVPDQ